MFSHLEASWRISKRGSHTASLWGEVISACLSMRWCPSQIHHEVRESPSFSVRWGQSPCLSMRWCLSHIHHEVRESPCFSVRWGQWGDVRHRFTMGWGSLPAVHCEVRSVSLPLYEEMSLTDSLWGQRVSQQFSVRWGQSQIHHEVRESHSFSMRWGQSPCLSMRWCPSQIHHEVRESHRFSMRWGLSPSYTPFWGLFSLVGFSGGEGPQTLVRWGTFNVSSVCQLV